MFLVPQCEGPKHGSCSMVVHQHLLSKCDGSLSCQTAHWNNKLCQDFNIHVGSQKLHQQNSCNGIARAFNLTNNSLPRMSSIVLSNTGYNRVHIAFLWCYSQKNLRKSLHLGGAQNLQVSYKFLTPRRFDLCFRIECNFVVKDWYQNIFFLHIRKVEVRNLITWTFSTSLTNSLDTTFPASYFPC